MIKKRRGYLEQSPVYFDDSDDVGGIPGPEPLEITEAKVVPSGEILYLKFNQEINIDTTFTKNKPVVLHIQHGVSEIDVGVIDLIPNGLDGVDCYLPQVEVPFTIGENAFPAYIKSAYNLTMNYIGGQNESFIIEDLLGNELADITGMAVQNLSELT